MRTCVFGLLVCLLGFGSAAGAEIHGEMRTRWAGQVGEVPLGEYPRPTMVREGWTNLNGTWEYAIMGREAGRPTSWDGGIVVPFAVESQLSGVQRAVGAEQRLWYRRTFEADAGAGRALLHFGAVDWEATVWVNGVEVGTHRGGFDAFSFDVTAALALGKSGTHELVVSVWDPTDAGPQPRGKQVREPRGIFYTAVTGIWQTVWLEVVPEVSVERLVVTPDLERKSVWVQAMVRGGSGGRAKPVSVVVKEGGRVVAEGSGDAGQRIEVPLGEVKTWAPGSPFLYGLEVRVGDDRVGSYFGMRKIELREDEWGFKRLFLNDEVVFQYGPLDQGWWPDGLYTAPTDEALRWDIEKTLEMGFNMARKHVKVEPARWYYWADKLGLLVWQDMPSLMERGKRQQVKKGEKEDIVLSERESVQYRAELKAMVEGLIHHPSIVVWVPFNEGWGQHKTNPTLDWVKWLDPTRLVDGPSGWEDRGGGEMHDMHLYPGPGMFAAGEVRASVLGEFGGLGLAMKEHLWWNKRNWGYRSFESEAELSENYGRLVDELKPLIGRGLAAAVYTQTTDVEGEVNGLISYDREVVKIDAGHLSKLHAGLYEAQRPTRTVVLVATSEKEGVRWRYTDEKPGDGWEAEGFDDSGWKEGAGGFGTAGTPGSVVRTTWDSGDLWVRRRFEWDGEERPGLQVRMAHDEDAEIYVNGVLVMEVEKWTDRYVNFPVSAKLEAALKKGTNTVAIHVKQTTGGQYIDWGLVEEVAYDSPEAFKKAREQARFDADRQYGTMKTRWAAEVDAEKPLPEYPRPRVVRTGRAEGDWSNLNGEWDYAVVDRGVEKPESWDGKIVVPFPAESQLSGVQRLPGKDRHLWYRRTFDAPELDEDAEEVLRLRFGAVDWETTVFVNGHEVGTHRGGYDGFSFDITRFLRGDGTEQELMVRVWDPTDAGKQPRGKQRVNPGGIMYTPVTGIWQTVWLEPLPKVWIEDLKIVPDVAGKRFKVTVDSAGRSEAGKPVSVDVLARDGGSIVGVTSTGAVGAEMSLPIPLPELWTPENPHLYGIEAVLKVDGVEVDRVYSYGGLREIGLVKDETGQARIALNGEVQFLMGPLDQGWWPDGLYTAPTDEALRYDIEATKAMGFNVARKHVKVEPARWYYWADVLGLLVWQDMPSGNVARNEILEGEKRGADEDAALFKAELERMVGGLGSHPSVGIWTIFNEGWGQHRSGELIRWLKEEDPSRLAGGPSGWQDHGVGDLLDLHRYPGPSMPAATSKERALVLSEYGGLKGAVPEHLWKTGGNWGYDDADDGSGDLQNGLRARYAAMNGELEVLIEAGLSAAIYTQTTDCEIEVNGFLTYDRAVNKFGEAWLAAANAKLYDVERVSALQVVLATSGEVGQAWRYVREAPGEGWEQAGFDDSGWESGEAPFGDPAVAAEGVFPVRTTWADGEIWLRREFELEDVEFGDLMLKILNNGEATVYLNGVDLGRRSGWSSMYRLTVLEPGVELLREGRNVLAVKVQGGRHRRFFDAGLVRVE